MEQHSVGPRTILVEHQSVLPFNFRRSGNKDITKITHHSEK